MNRMKMPVVAIVGRPNVGKSSLLNAMVGRRISIVQDMPGVTRDRVSTPLEIQGKFVELVDTGGYGFDDATGLTEHIRHQIDLAMSRADLVLFIVDCQSGLTSGDQIIADLLRKQSLPTLLVANKTDGPRSDPALGDFARLGLGTPLGVSALNDRHIDQLLNAIAKQIDLSQAPAELPAPQMMLAIVGKRNAGKSTLVNSIAGLFEGDTDRVIVSEVPGTTRDSIDVRFEKDGKTLIVIDTAGVRKKRHMMTHDIEFYSFHRAERSIRRADVVLHLIDGTEPISEPDKKLSQYIREQHKPVILVINKWDLTRRKARENAPDTGEQKQHTDEDLMEQFAEYLNKEMPQVDFAPIAFVTAKDGRNVQAVVDMAQHLFKQATFRVTTHKLNEAIRQVLDERTPSAPGGKRIKVYYATQTDTAPPTIVLFVNHPEYVTDSYQRYMINRLRELLPYDEVPIRLIVRARTPAKTESAMEDRAKPRHGSARRSPPSDKRPAASGKRTPAPPARKPSPGKAPARGKPRAKPQARTKGNVKRSPRRK